MCLNAHCRVISVRRPQIKTPKTEGCTAPAQIWCCFWAELVNSSVGPQTRGWTLQIQSSSRSETPEVQPWCCCWRRPATSSWPRPASSSRRSSCRLCDWRPTSFWSSGQASGPHCPSLPPGRYFFSSSQFSCLPWWLKGSRQAWTFPLSLTKLFFSDFFSYSPISCKYISSSNVINYNGKTVNGSIFPNLQKRNWNIFLTR